MRAVWFPERLRGLVLHALANGKILEIHIEREAIVRVLVAVAHEAPLAVLIDAVRNVRASVLCCVSKHFLQLTLLC